jgi:hypothetical protein
MPVSLLVGDAETLGTKERQMKVWIFILKAFGYVWLTAAVLLILAGIVGTWLKGGFAAVQELLSPFNVINWIVTIITLAPGLGAIAWAEKLNAKKAVSL